MKPSSRSLSSLPPRGGSGPCDLPKLLYIGDVPAESTTSGAALLYRLLQSYPSDRLRIVQSEEMQTAPDNRLPNVQYETFRLSFERLMRSRFKNVGGWIRYQAAQWRGTELRRLAASFDAQAILTIAHGYSWMGAAAFARQRRIPLHLIVHDNVGDTLQVPDRLKPQVRQRFEACWRQAASRWCVSPKMAEVYSLPDAPGSVLYPSWPIDRVAFDAPPEASHLRAGGVRLGYAGTLHTVGYVGMLTTLAQVLEGTGGRLVLYAGSNPPRTLIERSNVDSRGFVTNSRLLTKLRETVDVLVLPMSFEPADRPNMELSFPSKLTEYTSTGLPILIWGPPSCSAVRWARENPGVAQVVTEGSPAAVEDAVSRLAKDPARRVEMARSAANVGQKMFSHEAVTGDFLDSLRRIAHSH